MPENTAYTTQLFYDIAGYPNVIGAIDCTHVALTNASNHFLRLKPADATRSVKNCIILLLPENNYCMQESLPDSVSDMEYDQDDDVET